MPKLWADERAIRQICLNFLSNAIKFTPQGGEIWIKAGWTASGGQYLSVKDTGPGIPEEEIPIVLASFGQGSNSIKSAEQGAGLGLPIAKSLIDLHGGTFALKSKLRIGTEVIVTFPPERVMSALAPLAEPAPPISAAAAAERRTLAAGAAVGDAQAAVLPGLIASGACRMIAFPAAMLMFAAHVAAPTSMTFVANVRRPSKARATRSARSIRHSVLCIGCGRSACRDHAAGIGYEPTTSARASWRSCRARLAARYALANRRQARPEGQRRAQPALVPAGDRTGRAAVHLSRAERHHGRRG